MGPLEDYRSEKLPSNHIRPSAGFGLLASRLDFEGYHAVAFSLLNWSCAPGDNRDNSQAQKYRSSTFQGSLLDMGEEHIKEPNYSNLRNQSSVRR